MSIHKKISLLLALLLHQFCIGQKVTDNVFFEAGVAYRQGLLELKNYPARAGRIENSMGYQFGGISLLSRVFMLNVAGGYAFNDKNRLQLSNYLYKNYLVTLADSVNRLTDRLYAVKADVFIDYIHSFLPRKKNRLTFESGVGFGVMNISKSFTYTDYEYIFDENNNYVKIKRDLKQKAFSFFAPRIILGLRYKNIQVQIIDHITPDEDLNNKLSFWFEGRLLYHFTLPKRKKGIN